jgi:hypothetical protein
MLVNCCMMDCVVAMPLLVAIAGGDAIAGPRLQHMFKGLRAFLMPKI